MKKLIKKYENRLAVLVDNKRYDKTSGYPYDHEIKCVTEFLKDLKKTDNYTHVTNEGESASVPPFPIISKLPI